MSRHQEPTSTSGINENPERYSTTHPHVNPGSSRVQNQPIVVLTLEATAVRCPRLRQSQRMVYRRRVYSVRRRDQPAWWTRRAIDVIVSDVNIQPNRTDITAIASGKSI